MIRLLSAIVLFVCCYCGLPTTAHAIDGGRYGPVKIVLPDRPARGFVIFFSDRNGLTAADDSAARSVANDGALLVEVDTPTYLTNLGKLNDKCHHLVGDAEGLSR